MLGNNEEILCFDEQCPPMLNFALGLEGGDGAGSGSCPPGAESDRGLSREPLAMHRSTGSPVFVRACSLDEQASVDMVQGTDSAAVTDAFLQWLQNGASSVVSLEWAHNKEALSQVMESLDIDFLTTRDLLFEPPPPPNHTTLRYDASL